MPRKDKGHGIEDPLQALSRLYQRMEEAYEQVAAQLGLTCDGCNDNCCLSYFQHHTYIEWAYLWRGLQACEPDVRLAFQEKAREYVQTARNALAAGHKPRIMCPLNQEGWCGLYPFRMMICRLHGVPNRVRMPDGRTREFPGCATCQDLVNRKDRFAALDRTAFYVELAGLERAFITRAGQDLPRVKLTLAEMIIQGPPPIAFDS